MVHCYTLLMIGLPLAGDGLVHAGLLGLGILAALLFYAYEKRPNVRAQAPGSLAT